MPALQIRPMAASERRMVFVELRRTRWLRLLALRDLAALAAAAAACAYGLGPAVVAAVRASDDGSAGGDGGFKVMLCCAVLIVLLMVLRRLRRRMAVLGREARRLRRDIRTELVEETDHRTTRVLLLESEADGWLAAFLEDEDRNTLFVEALPNGHADPGLLERFPPAAVRFETGLHSGIALMETREGPFDGPTDAVALTGRPRRLPVHGTVIGEPIELAAPRILRRSGL